MKINKQAFELVGLTEEDFYKWCEDNHKRSDRKKVRADFFNRIREGKIYIDSSTGKIITKSQRRKEEEC